jgi:hypothetical protein
MNGFGDTIAAILKETGIATVVKAVVGEDCGCAARQQKLNELFPYGKTKEAVRDEQEVHPEAKG